MLDNGVEMCLIFRQILGLLVLSWAPNHFVLGAQLAPGEKNGLFPCIVCGNTNYKAIKIFHGNINCKFFVSY